MRTYDSAADTSDTGVGKTFTACAVIATLQLPTLVVVPKISVTSWHSTAAIFGEKISVIGYEKLRTGNSPFGSWQYQDEINQPAKITLSCEICQRKFDGDAPLDPCPYHVHGIHCVSVHRKPRRYGVFAFNPAVRFIVFDESHRLGGLDSLNADMLFAAKRQGIKHLLLSATLAQSPLGLNAIGYSLDLHAGPHDDLVRQLPNFFRWAARYGVRRDPAFRGFKWFAGAERQKSAMQEIRASIADRSVRVTCDEIPGFPEQEITAELYDIDERLDDIYKEMERAIAELRNNSESDKDPEHPLTKILRAQQEIEILKVPLCAEIAQDAFAKGLSVGIFCNFQATIDELSKRLDCFFLDGRVTGEKRDQIISKFQSNEIRCLAINSTVGGISLNLQDLDGEHPRLGLVFPPWSATVFKQLCGRFRRESGKSKSHFRVLLAANSDVEKKIHRALQSKLNALDSLMDGDLMPENLRLS